MNSSQISYTISSSKHLEELFDFVNRHLTIMESAMIQYQDPIELLDEKMKIKLPSPIEQPLAKYLARFLPEIEKVTTQLIGDLCPICYQLYLPNEKCRTLICQHTYHANCIDGWFGNNLDDLSCPICRKSQYNDIGKLV